MDRNLNILADGCESLGIPLTEKQTEQFLIYYEALIEKNKVMNLTAITDFSEVMIKHFIDSLTAVKILDLREGMRVLDLGTGAGFPGIPLKIVFPDVSFVLLDSLKKRICFLDEVIEKCGLERITAVHGRAEELARKVEYREQFDVCVSRAVANLSSLSEYCLPYVKCGGHFISYKSMNVDTEIERARKAISLLGGNIQDVVKFQLADQNGETMERSLVVTHKRKATPARYPRRAGLPSKEPL